MFPGPRIFRSRYAALMFAGSVIWTAYDVADSAPAPAPANAAAPAQEDATGAPINDADLAILANAMR